MSIFNKKKASKASVEKEMYDKNMYGYRDLKDQLDHQEWLHSYIQKADSQYDKDQNLVDLISKYEHAFIKSEPPLKVSWNLRLADYYILAGMRDKAWGYLIFLLLHDYAPRNRIRLYQAKVLKKEKKYLDAVEMYMLGHLAKSEWNNTYNENLFLKDIKSCANKLKWDSDMMCCLSDLIQQQVGRRNYAEDTLIRSYRKIIKEGGG